MNSLGNYVLNGNDNIPTQNGHVNYKNIVF